MKITGGIEWDEETLGNGDVVSYGEGEGRTFVVVQGRRLANVTIRYPDGSEEVVGGFLSSEVAKSWCERENS